ncbi:MAG: septum formation protein Maf [candidate division Zixibacteria bacterium]|nr:septum formation protein Maf [candidate division Zixibacteria bacterium]
MTYNNLKKLSQKKEIILGSASPRRLKLLGETGIDFRQIISDLRESDNPAGDTFEHALSLAKMKAMAVSSESGADKLVIGADTIVVLDNVLIGKPEDENEARQILSRLSGNKHVVCTALALVSSTQLLASGYELTDVYFNLVSEDAIADYVSSGEPMDKAGAYGIQGKGGFLVDRIEGELDNVIGLPRSLLDKLAGEVCLKME